MLVAYSSPPSSQPYRSFQRSSAWCACQISDIWVALRKKTKLGSLKKFTVLHRSEPILLFLLRAAQMLKYIEIWHAPHALKYLPQRQNSYFFNSLVFFTILLFTDITWARAPKWIIVKFDHFLSWFAIFKALNKFQISKMLFYSNEYANERSKK